MEIRIFKPGTKTVEELAYEKEFVKRVNKVAAHNASKNYNTNVSKKYKKVATRKSIPIYQVDRDTAEILASFKSMKDAGKSINMTSGNFSAMMIDRPIYKPVLIKGRWFIKQSHYEQWKKSKG